ncbi:MAG TPA: YciI family protein [Steroidobacteraceae bacterium]|nr:YciI family protein [Steroidobacteraceae bacterium]
MQIPLRHVEFALCGTTRERRCTPFTTGTDMNYLLLIYANETETMAMGEAVLQKMSGEYMDFTKSIVQAGNFKAGDRLRSVSSASTVRVRNGKVAITDGPFAEAREQLGGYYLIEAKNLDEATDIASRIPGARYGSVEVRPIWPL